MNSEGCPQFYNSVIPLMSGVHKGLVFDSASKDYGFAADSGAIPVVIEEFVAAQGEYPIVFTQGDCPLPVALMALPGMPNRHVDGQGQWSPGRYVPAYVRRYPFILAKLDSGATDLTLCFDSESKRFRDGEEGNLFAGDEPTALTREALAFCERFEAAAQRTTAFVRELAELELFVDAEASVERDGGAPKTLRGFQMVSEEKLRQLQGDQCRHLIQSGAMALIFAHLFSLRQIEPILREGASPSSN
jgi:SapC